MARRNLRNLDQRILLRTIFEGGKYGIDSISGKRIAAFLRITEPTIYVHFQSKKNLLAKAYQLAVAHLYGSLEAEECDNLEEFLSDDLIFIAQQAKKYPNDVLYVFGYRHLPDAVIGSPVDTPKGQNLYNAIRNSWHHGNGVAPSSSFCPYIDQQLFLYAIQTIDDYAFGIAKGEIDENPATAKFLAALLISSLAGGKAVFLKSLSAADKDTLAKKAKDCGLFAETKLN
jgi:AcrR family transcriptional regulator